MVVESLSLDAAAAQSAAWQQLFDDCLEPNVFLTPGFALAAARHLAKMGSPRFLFVWDNDGKKRHLRAVCPLAATGMLKHWLPLRLWTHAQAPLGTPLLAAAHAEAALAAILAHLPVQQPKATGLLFPLLPQKGPTAQLLLKVASAEGRTVKIFGAHRRAILTPGSDAESYLQQSVAAARRRKLKRARAALESKGAIAFHIIRTEPELSAATETFLALEAEGWKGRRGSAFLKSAKRTAFARQSLAALAAAGRCFIASLTFDNHPLAMALMLTTVNQAYWWKITYDEAFAAFSPGVLLALEMTKYLLADATIRLTDSCSSEDHPMIEHIWSERLDIADLLIELDVGRRPQFEALARREALRRRARAKLKALVRSLRRD